MLNKKRKGFTIVELVIVIAVIAVLAAVLIPTFAGIIDKANESADKQAVRQMNIALAAESIENKPDDVGDVIDILAAAGFNSTDKLVPVSAGHGFYWSKDANMITLIRDEGDESPELIFPTEEAALNTAFDAAKTDWTAATTGANVVFFDLETAGINKGLPTGSGTGSGNGGAGNGDGTVSDPYTVSTEAQLKDALSKGGYIKLTKNIDLTNTDGAVSISEDVNIDLAGYPLTLKDTAEPSEDYASNVITVANGGVLTISNTGTGGGIVIEEPTFEDYWMCDYAGILVEAGGKLELDGVKLTINAYHTAIANNGTATLKNGANVTVNGGTGLSNEGIAAIQGATFTVNSGTGFANYYAGTVEDVKISGNTSFLLNGDDAIAIENDGGRMSVIETDVLKGDDFTYDEYYYYGTIYVTDSASSGNSEISLENVTVAEGMGTSVKVGTSCKATIKSGEYNGVVKSAGTLYIEDGEFYSLSANDTSTVTINGGTFSGELSFDIDKNNLVSINGGTFKGIVYVKKETRLNIGKDSEQDTTLKFTMPLDVTGDNPHVYIYAGEFVYEENSEYKPVTFDAFIEKNEFKEAEVALTTGGVTSEITVYRALYADCVYRFYTSSKSYSIHQVDSHLVICRSDQTYQ